MSEEMRLQKFLAHAGVASRRQAEKIIATGRVKVNGEIADIPAIKVTSGQDKVTLDGKLVTISTKYVYLALNKPKGYITSCKQGQRDIVMDLVNLSMRLYPVGRLDKDSTGLILLTNDGRLHHRFSHPSFDHEKEYVVDLIRPITDRNLTRMARGMDIQGRVTRKARVKRLGRKSFGIILKEGRNRQIRRMVKKTGNEVKSLHRVRVSHIKLGNLAPGKWRHLTRAEEKKIVEILTA